MTKSIDLSFQVGDQVRHGNQVRSDGVIIKMLPGGKAEVRFTAWHTRPIEYSTHVMKLKELSHSCHNHKAPFLSNVLDEEGAYKDGYHSGLAIGLGTQQFYQAGGPHVYKSSRSECRHLQQHAEFDIANNKAWRRGWAAGQEHAKMAKPLDFTKPLRTVNTHRKVHYVGKLAPDSDIHIINISSGDHPPKFSGALERINEFGSMCHGKYEIVVENVPEARRLTIALSPDGETLRMPGFHQITDIFIDVTVLDGQVTELRARDR